MTKKLKIILLIFVLCLIGTGVFLADSITDTFTDESKIASKSNITVTGGQVMLSTLKANGESCSSGDECESTYCVDDYCCNTACSGNCNRCNVGGSLGVCTDVNSDCAGTGDSCYCNSGNCQACLNTPASCNCSSYTCQTCPDAYGDCGVPTCSSYTCGNSAYAINTQSGSCTGCKYCNGSGSCLTCSLTVTGSFPDTYGTYYGYYCKPSVNGQSFYANVGASCSSVLSTTTGYWSGWTLYQYRCNCQ